MPADPGVYAKAQKQRLHVAGKPMAARRVVDVRRLTRAAKPDASIGGPKVPEEGRDRLVTAGQRPPRALASHVTVVQKPLAHPAMPQPDCAFRGSGAPRQSDRPGTSSARAEPGAEPRCPNTLRERSATSSASLRSLLVYWIACLGRVQPSPIRCPRSASSSSRMRDIRGPGRFPARQSVLPSLSSSRRFQPPIVRNLWLRGSANRPAKPGRQT